MKILITGARGYVGGYLQKELQDCDIAYAAAGRQECDLSDYDGMCKYLEEQEITHIIHLAGTVGTNDAKALFEGNISGLYNLLSACSQSAVEHFTFVSTNNVYAANEEQKHDAEEMCAPERNNLYGLSKYVGELLVSDFCTKREIPYAIVRISDIYGPGQKYGNLLKAIVNSAQNGSSLKQYGAGRRKRDYIYVTDVAKGLRFISAGSLTGVMNLGTGVGTSVAQLVDMAAELSGGICKIEMVDVKEEDTSSIVLDVEPLRAAGFSAAVTVYEGLRRCILEEHDGNA